MSRQIDDILTSRTSSTRDQKGSATSPQDVMRAIYFRWKVASGREREFEQAWMELIELVRDERGGLGSRLHRYTDGRYFAYAQWPPEVVGRSRQDPDDTGARIGHSEPHDERQRHGVKRRFRGPRRGPEFVSECQT